LLVSGRSHPELSLTRAAHSVQDQLTSLWLAA